MYCTAFWIYVWAGWVAKIRADVYHCPQLSERSAKLFDCFFGVSSTVITSTGAIGGWASIASASNVLDQGGLIRQPFALYWHFGLFHLNTTTIIHYTQSPSSASLSHLCQRNWSWTHSHKRQQQKQHYKREFAIGAINCSLWFCKKDHHNE